MADEVAIGYALVVDRGSMDPNATKLDGGLLAKDGRGNFHIYTRKEAAPSPLDFERIVRVEIRAVQ